MNSDCLRGFGPVGTNGPVPRHPSTLLEVFRRGDHLTDEELEILARKMGELSDLCNDFGPMFTLQGSYAEKVRHDCRTFLLKRRESAANR